MNDFLKNFESITIPNDIHRQAVAGLGEAALALTNAPEGAALDQAEAALLAAKEAITAALSEVYDREKPLTVWR